MGKNSESGLITKRDSKVRGKVGRKKRVVGLILVQGFMGLVKSTFLLEARSWKLEGFGSQLMVHGFS
ncbi:MAG TPA: hypothetical protein DDY13_15925 [Cytophagales bacterium]|nr:hypothetical protein [Cytophagales bacterium]